MERGQNDLRESEAMGVEVLEKNAAVATSTW